MIFNIRGGGGILMKNDTISILGGDSRQYYLAKYFIDKGMNISCWGNKEFQKLPKANIASDLDYALEQTILIGPVPFSKDNFKLTNNCYHEITLSKLYSKLYKGQLLIGGNLAEEIIHLCDEKQAFYYDYMKSESLGIMNAEITAEGLLCELLLNTPFIIQDVNILLLGYGKCGKMIAHKLNSLGCHVTICEQQPLLRDLAVSFGYNAISNDELKKQISNCKILINTIPTSIMEESDYSNISKDCFLFDIASMPGGIDKEIANRFHIPVFHCLGLPGKIAPVSAGEAIGKDIYNYLKYNYNK